MLPHHQVTKLALCLFFPPTPHTTYHTPQTLERSYLLRLHGKVVERPQHMLMRVAIGIHMQDVDEAVKTYHLLRYVSIVGGCLCLCGSMCVCVVVVGPCIVYSVSAGCWKVHGQAVVLASNATHVGD